MKKIGILAIAVFCVFTTAAWVNAAEDTLDASVSKTVTPSDVPPAGTAGTDAAPADAAAAVAPVENAAPEPPAADNLEFVSGEVSSADEAAKTVTVKLYGEGEAQASEKVLSVKVDEATDITDGEKDRDLKSLTAGTEVDVEYDPTTNKATYIFVY